MLRTCRACGSPRGARNWYGTLLPTANSPPRRVRAARLWTGGLSRSRSVCPREPGVADISGAQGLDDSGCLEQNSRILRALAQVAGFSLEHENTRRHQTAALTQHAHERHLAPGHEQRATRGQHAEQTFHDPRPGLLTEIDQHVL